MHSRVKKVWIDPSYWLLFMEVLLSSIKLPDVEVKNVLEDRLVAESCDKDAMLSCRPFARCQGTILCNSTVRKLYPLTVASTQNSLAILTTHSTETTLHLWYVCGLAVVKLQTMFRKIFTNGQSMKILVNKNFSW